MSVPADVGKLPFLASIIALGLLAYEASPASAQSFNCRDAHYADEAAICQDQALSRLDDQLARTFSQAMRRLPAEEQRRLGRDEDSWVAGRRRCGADPNCIARTYHNRMQQLERMGAAKEQRPPAPPPGFPPPPPFFGGGTPYASGIPVPPPPFADFRPPPAQPANPRVIERSQSTEVIEQRNDRAPQSRSTEAVEQPDRQSSSGDARISGQTVERDRRPAPQLGNRQSAGATEPRDGGGSGGATAIEGSTEPPDRSPGANEPSLGSDRVAPRERAALPESEGSVHREISRHSEMKATAHTLKEKAKRKPATEPATGAADDRQAEPAASPSSASANAHHETRAAAAAPPAPPPLPSSGSATPDSRKPAIRWIDPPASK